MTKLTDAGAVYNQHDAAFSHVSAYVVIDKRDGACVAKVAIKRSTSGLRTTAFVHWLGVPMVKGVANGGGYDKDSASVANAARRMLDLMGIEPRLTREALDDYDAFRAAASLDGGKRWDDAVRDAGFSVFQAV
ncbi:hypothetical protein [Bosea lathyri]|uniref:Uncharacterized protein n=1 Tax=Bosea lathyri TaxID=1036778 RepID=A0A1H6BVC3_9HYPH|nr:hypothetical protein [Bosea lathyri]SEG64681.1 hypothetical protein SAMN04488115_108116 [Bosea lathyri]